MKSYKVSVSVLLDPVGHPDVVISCDDQIKEIILAESTWIDFDYEAYQGSNRLTVEHRNRHPNDGVTAVIVKTIRFNGIEHLSHTYPGIYYPKDMEPRRDTYIAWNGIWTLDFTVPTYTWMHKTQGLGWIYD